MIKPTKPLYALITGANREIGFAIAQFLLSQNIFIFLTSRNLKSAQEALETLTASGECGAALSLDVTSLTSIQNAISAVQREVHHLDILVNTGIAHIADPTKPEEVLASYTSILNTNVTSVALITDAFAPLLKAAPGGGRVINVSSGRASLTNNSKGILPSSAVVPYNVSKAALSMLTVEYARTLALEVNVNAVNPGHCRTVFNSYRGKKDPVDGARVVLELTVGQGKGEFRRVAW